MKVGVLATGRILTGGNDGHLGPLRCGGPFSFSKTFLYTRGSVHLCAPV